MSELYGNLVGVLIVLLMLVFVGIWCWAWLPRHERTFDALARIPMQERAERGDERRPGP